MKGRIIHTGWVANTEERAINMEGWAHDERSVIHGGKHHI